MRGKHEVRLDQNDTPLDISLSIDGFIGCLCPSLNGTHKRVVTYIDGRDDHFDRERKEQ